MIQDGQFILMTPEEFIPWIMQQNINRQINHIQNHHTWSPSYKDGDNVIQMVKNMKNYHVNTLGWADIAQHFSTSKNGLICTGRSLEKIPAGISKHNSGGICIEHIINGDIGGDVMTPQQAHAILVLNAALLMKFNLPINTNTVVYHNWFGHLSPENIKTCPGANFFGGNSQQSAINNFYPRIKNAIGYVQSLLSPTPQWIIDGEKFLRDSGFTAQKHDPSSLVTMELFAYMVNNYTTKINPINPITYLTQNNYIKQQHSPNKALTWDIFGWMVANKHGVTVADPVAYLLSIGALTQPKKHSDAINFGTFGAVMRNFITNNIKF